MAQRAKRVRASRSLCAWQNRGWTERRWTKRLGARMLAHMKPLTRFAAAIFAGVCLLATISRSHSAPPNVIVVLADQWRPQAFGFAGDANVRTPNFDRLAGESVRFMNAVSGMPVCSPTRASLLTGQRP